MLKLTLAPNREDIFYAMALCFGIVSIREGKLVVGPWQDLAQLGPNIRPSQIEFLYKRLVQDIVEMTFMAPARTRSERRF